MPDENLVPEDQYIDDAIDENEVDGEAELFKALESLSDSEFEEEFEDEYEDEDDYEDSEEDSEEDEDTEYEDEDEELDSDEDEDDIETDEEKGTKREQSREENARFAAERRQKDLDKRVATELERLKNESPEFALSKQLSEMYGIPPDQIIQQMKDAKLQEESKKLNVPLAMLKEREAERERLSQVEGELNQLRYEGWQSRIRSEAVTLQNDFKMLSEEDINSAVDYILHEAKNVDMPLEQAVYALHGRKIIEHSVKGKSQEKLAAESGRKKKVPPSPNNGKASQVKTLSDDEKYVAQQMGISADDYLKYK